MVKRIDAGLVLSDDLVQGALSNKYIADEVYKILKQAGMNIPTSPITPTTKESSSETLKKLLAIGKELNVRQQTEGPTASQPT